MWVSPVEITLILFSQVRGRPSVDTDTTQDEIAVESSAEVTAVEQPKVITETLPKVDDAGKTDSVISKAFEIVQTSEAVISEEDGQPKPFILKMPTSEVPAEFDGMRPQDGVTVSAPHTQISREGTPPVGPGDEYMYINVTSAPAATAGGTPAPASAAATADSSSVQQVGLQHV